MKTLSPAKIEKIWNAISNFLKDAKKKGRDEIDQTSADANYYEGREDGLQSALNVIDYHLKN